MTFIETKRIIEIYVIGLEPNNPEYNKRLAWAVQVARESDTGKIVSIVGINPDEKGGTVVLQENI